MAREIIFMGKTYVPAPVESRGPDYGAWCTGCVAVQASGQMLCNCLPCTGTDAEPGDVIFKLKELK